MRRVVVVQNCPSAPIVGESVEKVLLLVFEGSSETGGGGGVGWEGGGGWGDSRVRGGELDGPGCERLTSSTDF